MNTCTTVYYTADTIENSEGSVRYLQVATVTEILIGLKSNDDQHWSYWFLIQWTAEEQSVVLFGRGRGVKVQSKYFSGVIAVALSANTEMWHLCIPSASFALWDTFGKWKRERATFTAPWDEKVPFFSKLCTENKQLHSWLPLFAPWLSSADKTGAGRLIN